jgi:hypothetical protein
MSRTDNHRPHDVQLADPYEKRWHRICDHQKVAWWPLYRFGCPRSSHCGGWWIVLDRRRRRHAAQRCLREALKGNWEACE